jgi:hypothetical protein
VLTSVFSSFVLLSIFIFYRNAGIGRRSMFSKAGGVDCGQRGGEREREEEEEEEEIVVRDGGGKEIHEEREVGQKGGERRREGGRYFVGGLQAG